MQQQGVYEQQKPVDNYQQQQIPYNYPPPMYQNPPPPVVQPGYYNPPPPVYQPQPSFPMQMSKNFRI